VAPAARNGGCGLSRWNGSTAGEGSTFDKPGSGFASWAAKAVARHASNQRSPPTGKVEEYTRFGESSTVSETAGGKTRRTVTRYDGADRVTSVEITSDEGVALPAVTTDYDPVSGQVTVTRSGAATITREYDRLGRVLTYTDADGGVTRSEFDHYGKPAKMADNTGTTMFGYDRVAEPRGLLTSVTDSIAGTFRATYSPDGQLVELKYPGGMTRTDTLDASFTPVGRVYKRDSDGQVIYSESVVENTQGQQVNHAYTVGRRTTATTGWAG
jgi:YD repeat-containing protein